MQLRATGTGENLASHGSEIGAKINIHSDGLMSIIMPETDAAWINLQTRLAHRRLHELTTALKEGTMAVEEYDVFILGPAQAVICVRCDHPAAHQSGSINAMCVEMLTNFLHNTRHDNLPLEALPCSTPAGGKVACFYTDCFYSELLENRADTLEPGSALTPPRTLKQ
jgi:hypothetical protein